MRDDPVVYAIAATGALGIGMILSDSRLLLIIFLLASLALAVIGIKKSYDYNTAKIYCIVLTAITSIYLFVVIIKLFV